MFLSEAIVSNISLSDAAISVTLGTRGGDILAREGPVEDGDRTGEHALHQFLSEGNGVGDPGRRDARHARNITHDDSQL